MAAVAARRLVRSLSQRCRQGVPGVLLDWLPAGQPDARPTATPQSPHVAVLYKYDSPLLRHLSTSGYPTVSPSSPERAVDSLPDYGELKQRALSARQSPELQLQLLPGEQEHFQNVMRHFQQSAAVKDQALGLYVNSKLFKQAVQEFEKFLVRGMLPALRDAVLVLPPGPAAADGLFPLFAQFVLDHYMDAIRHYRTVVQTADLRRPHQWFPVARSLSRRIIYHAGPTNSGKTYNALVAMKGAEAGVYCGPLRLLAMEVYDNCNADGTFCNLVTGQERREVPGARHVACTVEMVNTQRRVDVAVIDEIQMIGDESRGWAWTRALVGVPANEVHLCGDGSAVGLVRRICEEMGEPFELRTYERFTTLEVEGGGLQGGYKAVQPGDCIVAFSRRDIYDIKQYIERETQHRACVVYGALPPETRRMQARLFNDADTRYKVLVASDAVGMGLNLNIRRIIFHSMFKFDGGKRMSPVSTSMVKQIAGRAGRRSSQWGQGLATCRDPRHVGRLREALQVPLEDMVTPSAGLFPEFEHLEVYAGQHPEEKFRHLLTKFGKQALLDSSYFFCKQDSVLGAAKLLEELPLSLKDTYNFCMAPASASDLRLGAALVHFAEKYARGSPVHLSLDPPRRIPCNVAELKHMEAAHQVVMLWLWLSYRFEEEAFPGRERAQKVAAVICELLDKGLERVTRASKRGVDVGVEPARPLIENILEAFSEEHSRLSSERSESGSGGRRSRKVEEKLQAARLALELATEASPAAWEEYSSSSSSSSSPGAAAAGGDGDKGAVSEEVVATEDVGGLRGAGVDEAGSQMKAAGGPKNKKRWTKPRGGRALSWRRHMNEGPGTALEEQQRDKRSKGGRGGGAGLKKVPAPLPAASPPSPAPHHAAPRGAGRSTKQGEKMKGSRRGAITEAAEQLAAELSGKAGDQVPRRMRA